jgi:hypothetical protein
MRTIKTEKCFCAACKTVGEEARVYDETGEHLSYRPPQGWYFVSYMECLTYFCESCMFNPAVDPSKY